MLTVLQTVNFKRQFQQICQDYPTLTVTILDFGQTTFVDSSGIGALVGCWKIAHEKQLPVILRNVPLQLSTALALADLEQLFVIESAEGLPLALASQTSGPAQPCSQPIDATEASSFVTHPAVQSRAKRLLDVAGAVAGLMMTAVLFPPIAIAIKLDSPGPIFFSQTRCSQMGRRFRMWKFRSMVMGAEQQQHLIANEATGALFKNANDPRITRVGRFLRKTSLDELPQFWNVLQGEMSLVGTRPPTPDEVERYEIPQWQRLDVKPGMTGEWQVNGRSTITNFEEVVRLDLKYQENWSLLYDLELILKTLWLIFNKNAGAL